MHGLALADLAEADRRADAANRDAMLQAVVGKGMTHAVNGRVRAELVQLAKLAQREWPKPDPATPPARDILWRAAAIAPAGQRQNGLYFAARLYDLHHQTADANRNYAACLVEGWSASSHFQSESFAAVTLRARGFDANDRKATADLAAVKVPAEGKPPATKPADR